MEKISVGIPHYNRSSLLVECLNNILEDDRIGEIVINDDFSPEEDFHKVLELKYESDKIKVFRNSSNLGAYKNKLETIKNCTLDWINESFLQKQSGLIKFEDFGIHYLNGSEWMPVDLQVREEKKSFF